MTKIIYIEREIKDHFRTKLICSKVSNPEIIVIDRFSEIFNKKNQSFKLQKNNPALIIAKKYKNLIHKTPENYGIGNKYNYYFSYMYNCLFDCKYCFLQGMYSSANFVIFVNYEDYYDEIKKISITNKKKNITIFSGYDFTDSMYESFAHGHDVVVASRFIRGGTMTGCPFLKNILVRCGYYSLYFLSCIPVMDASNGFRLFSKKLLDYVQIESKKGFTYSIELLVKARRLNLSISEIPAKWAERCNGSSNFKLFLWLSEYLKWYFYGLATFWLRKKSSTVRKKLVK